MADRPVRGKGTEPYAFCCADRLLAKRRAPEHQLQRLDSISKKSRGVQELPAPRSSSTPDHQASKADADAGQDGEAQHSPNEPLQRPSTSACKTDSKDTTAAKHTGMQLHHDVAATVHGNSLFPQETLSLRLTMNLLTIAGAPKGLAEASFYSKWRLGEVERCVLRLLAAAQRKLQGSSAEPYKVVFSAKTTSAETR